MGPDLRVALSQMDSRDDKPCNIERIAIDAQTAKHAGAEMLMLPEACAYRGRFRPEVPETEGGPVLSAICEIARQHRMAILVGGFWLRSHEPERPYNASLFIDETGTILATYRKVHLFRIEHSSVSEDEAAHTTAGDELVTVTWRAVTFGLSICFDLRYPELYRALALGGAEVLCVPANFSAHTGPAHWHTLLRARAIENACYVLAPAQAGIGADGFAAYGHSTVISPWGLPDADAGDKPGLLIAEISLDRLSECRATLNPLPQACLQKYTRVIRHHQLAYRGD